MERRVYVSESPNDYCLATPNPPAHPLYYCSLVISLSTCPQGSKTSECLCRTALPRVWFSGAPPPDSPVSLPGDPKKNR